MADPGRPSQSRDSQRISGRAASVDGNAPTRATGSQEIQRISRATGSTGSQEVQRISRVTGSYEQRASGRQSKITSTGPIPTLVTRARRRKKMLLGIGAGVLVLGGVVLFVLWGAWSDSYEPDPQLADRGSAPVAAVGAASPAARATPAPPPTHRRAPGATATQPAPAGAGDDSAGAGAIAATAPDAGTLARAQERDGGLAPSASGAGTHAASAPDAPTVARAQPRDGGLAPPVPPAEPRRTLALAASKAADAKPRPGPVDAGVAAASSPDAGRPPPPPRRDDARPFAADDYRGGHVSVERFAATGGSTMEGRIADFETGRPLAGATVEAIYGEQFIEVESDAGGNFEIPGMVPGSEVVVWVGGRRHQWVAERIDVSIPASGKKADVGVIKLLHGDEMSSRLEGWIGTYVTGRRGQVKVNAVNAWVPAYRAGIEVGDTILSVDGRDVRGLGSRAVGFLLRGPSGSSITIEVESGDGKRRKLTLERVVR